MEYPKEITEKYIDIRKILASKGVSPVSGVVERLLNRLLHIPQMNRTIYAYRDLKGLDFIHQFLEGNTEHDLNVKLDIVGSENIPQTGFPIMTGNHPLGGPDGMAVIAAVGHYRTDIKFPVNDFLMYLPGPRSLFVPIDKVHHKATNVDALEEAFAGENVLLYFPAGMCSRKHKGIIRDLDWKPTAIKKAIRYRRDIVPFYIEAQNRKRFYNLANLREKLGIKFNIEMALLPAEMYAQKGKTIRIIIGKPIPHETFDKRHTAKQWTDLLKEHVYALKDNPNATFGFTAPEERHQ
ncbi:MAG: glycerol acyltransferase [Bacteroidales bacterium]|nr:glycerol acyltransferase [Bacteroidales bacterium]